jgi:hypothetical protein
VPLLDGQFVDCGLEVGAGSPHQFLQFDLSFSVCMCAPLLVMQGLHQRSCFAD